MFLGYFVEKKAQKMSRYHPVQVQVLKSGFSAKFKSFRNSQSLSTTRRTFSTFTYSTAAHSTKLTSNLYPKIKKQ